MSTGVSPTGPRNGVQRSNPPNIQSNTNVMNRGASSPLNASARQFLPQTPSTHLDRYVHDMTINLKLVMDMAQQLKQGHFVLREEVVSLKKAHDGLRAEISSANNGPKLDVLNSSDDLDDEKLRRKFATLEAQTNGTHTPMPDKQKSNVAPVHQVVKSGKEVRGEYVPPHRRVAKGSAVRPVNSVGNGTHANGHATFDTPSGESNPSKTALPGPRAPSDISSTTMANTPRPSIEDPYHVNSSAIWKPLTIRNMPELPPDHMALIPTPSGMQTFSLDFIQATFGGESWSPGMFFIPKNALRCSLPGRTYYLLDARYDPYLPSHPGEHGAKLTPFFNENPLNDAADDIAYTDVPLFICASPSSVDPNKGRYVYFGHYSQTRWSDRLDFDRLTENVSRDVKMYWAEELSARGRAQWLTEALKKYFWPKPTYKGSILKTFPAEGTPVYQKVMSQFKTFMQEMADWEEEAKENVESLKKEDILEAFDREDANDFPGLRLFWEYLQCVGWKHDFYQYLLKEARTCPNP